MVAELVATAAKFKWWPNEVLLRPREVVAERFAVKAE